MKEEMKQTMETAAAGWRDSLGVIDKLFAVARPGAIFSEPVSAGEHTVITTSEVYVGVGVGYGSGGGTGYGPQPEAAESQETESMATEEAAKAVQKPPVGGEGYGGGGGGGGYSHGRPVAAVIIEPSGVRIEPIVDATKIALTMFTVVGSIFWMAFNMRRKALRGR